MTKTTDSKQPYYDELSPLRKRFVDNYIQNGGNQSKAYNDAGYTATSSSAIRSGASRLRALPDITEAIRERARPDHLKTLAENKKIMDEIYSIAIGESRVEIKEDEMYEMTPSQTDQINAAKLYNQIVPIGKEYKNKFEEERERLRIELLKAQIEVLKSSIGTDEDTETMISKDIDSILKSIDLHGGRGE